MASAQPGDQAATGAWTASWISDPKASPTEPGVFHFRKEMDLAARPATFPIRVLANNRYRLDVNGIEVASGPARGDLLNWRCETLDIATHLRAGRNTIAALVWNVGEYLPQ